MSLFVFLQRTEQGDAQAHQYCRVWLTRIVERFSRSSDPTPDELDRAVVTMSAALAPAQEAEAVQVRGLAGTLQHYFGGVLERSRLSQYLRDADTLGTEALQVSSIDVLQRSLDHLCAIETNWQIANGALAKLKDGQPPDIPSSWLDKGRRDQADIINALTSNRVRQHPLRHISETAEMKVDACARCHRNLPLDQQHQINFRYVAVCSNCGQLLIKTAP